MGDRMVSDLARKYVLNIINCAPAAEQAKKEGRYVYVGRPSKFGNPFVPGRDGTRSEVIQKYRDHLAASPVLVKLIKQELRGKILGCYCAPLSCHAEVLAELANEPYAAPW